MIILRKTVIGIGKILLFFILFVLALELGVRAIVYIGYKGYFNRYIAAKYQSPLKGVDDISEKFDNQVVMDPICYYTMKGGFFRGPKEQFNPMDKGLDETRIMCIGDSTTFGMFVDYNSTYPALLEGLLRSKYPSKKIEVLNAGIPGASSRQAKRVFQVYLINYEPDIVIWRKGAKLTDTHDIASIPKYRMSLWNFLYQSKLLRVIFIIADKIYPKLSPTFERGYNCIMGNSKSKVSQRGFNSNFDIVKKVALDNGAKHVLAVDFIYNFTGKQIESDYKSYTEKRISPLLITFDSFKEALRSNEIDEIFIDECHMTKMGTAIIASEIFKFIVDRGWIDN